MPAMPVGLGYVITVVNSGLKVRVSEVGLKLEPRSGPFKVSRSLLGYEILD